MTFRTPVGLSTIKLQETRESLGHITWFKCDNILVVVSYPWFTAPFNNTRTLKLKTQLTFAFFASASHNFDENQRTLEKETDKIDCNHLAFSPQSLLVCALFLSPPLTESLVQKLIEINQSQPTPPLNPLNVILFPEFACSEKRSNGRSNEESQE